MNKRRSGTAEFQRGWHEHPAVLAMSEYVADIGLEVHVQLRTKTKIWCGCANRYGSPPNTDVCPVCLGYPGALPVLNREAVALTSRTGLLLGSTISARCKWDRKNYFYPDMPKNYQISQYDRPLCEGGSMAIAVDGQEKVIGLTRIHLEEDVAKNTHFPGRSGIDFNRAGTPLMEIVTEPDMSSADEAFTFLSGLKQVLAYGEISDCNLEEGNIRCDINCSVRLGRSKGLGTKVEIKNMNTFRGVHRALTYEIKRQVAAVRNGDEIIQETRRWDDEGSVTRSMRTKEYAHDYRYLPDPDLLPVSIAVEDLDRWRSELPELPPARRKRFETEYGLPAYDAGVLVADKGLADYFEAATEECKKPKRVSNWIMTEMLRLLGEKGWNVDQARIGPSQLAKLIGLIDNGTINQTVAKTVFEEVFLEGGNPAKIVQERELSQVNDTGAIEDFADQAIAENSDSVEDFRAGKEKALQYLVGQVMRLSRGKANPQQVLTILREKL